MFESVSKQASDGYLSRAAALLASTPLAIADEATWRGLVARCPPLGRARWWLRLGAREPSMHLTTKALKTAARELKKASALYVQPHHLRAIAIAEGGVSAMLPVCERILNGEMPALAVKWVTCQKVVALSKCSHHQADIEARVKAAAAGEGSTYVAPVRPIVIGDALLRVAEKAYCVMRKDDFRTDNFGGGEQKTYTVQSR